MQFQPVLQVGKQVVVTRSKTRAVRGLVKQLPAEMVWQRLSASCCLWDMHCHGGALHHMSAFHTCCSQWPYTVVLVFHSTKCGLVHRWHTSLTQAHKNEICMNLLKITNVFFSLLVLLTTRYFLNSPHTITV
jgi:hypothetical protein